MTLCDTWSGKSRFKSILFAFPRCLSENPSGFIDGSTWRWTFSTIKEACCGQQILKNSIYIVIRTLQIIQKEYNLCEHIYCMFENQRNQFKGVKKRTLKKKTTSSYMRRQNILNGIKMVIYGDKCQNLSHNCQKVLIENGNKIGEKHIMYLKVHQKIKI